ncbi:MAG TPA: glycosyltransferase, partial [Epsilonproteobacteria bacterium]|nr:glycosyltransferase [Campylobacterota bacterium]
LACIEAVIRHTEHVSYEIIVMDDCSPHIQARQLGKYLKNILFFSNSENLGFLQNCNKGASFAQGSHLMFLNNDTNVQPGWLSSLVSLMAFSQKIGMVGSKLVYPDGQLQDAGGIIWREGNGWNYGRLDNPHKPEYNYVKEVDYLTGATMMIRKTVWDKIGGFDTRYIPAYYEDPDLAFEVRKAGYKVMYQPESLVIHFEGITNGRDLGSGVKRYQLINRKKFYEKWKAILEREHFSDGKRLFLARDRSAQKKHILFIDHYLPHYDQDAGSKATLHYLKLFVKNDIQVHFIGDNFYDYPETPYLGTLTQMGIEVLHGAWYGAHWQQWLRDNGPNMDYIILSRPHIAEKYIDTAREMSQAKIIYFGHDLHFLRELREYQIKQDPAILQSSIECLKRELDLSAKADMCYFFSDTEKKELHKINPFAAIDVVPLYIYDSFKHREKRVSQCKDILFVGGFSHTPNIDAMQWFCKSIWPIIEKTLPDITLYIIGSKPTEEIRALEKENIVVTGFVDDATLNRYYRTCRVAIAPLRYGAGIKGKVVDALYNGMPLVTTSIGAEGFENARSAMLIADQPEQFAEKVQMLYLDDALAERYAKGAEIYCRKYFSEAYAKEKM